MVIVDAIIIYCDFNLVSISLFCLILSYSVKNDVLYLVIQEIFVTFAICHLLKNNLYNIKTCHTKKHLIQ